MKKIATMILFAAVSLSLTACSNSQPAENSASSAQAEVTPTPSESADGTAENTETQAGNLEGNILIAYFSVPETDGVDTVAGASRVAVDGEVLGNNQYVAQLIQQEIGGDLFRIETVQEYPGTHEELLEFAYNEMTDEARPELATQIENLDSYDVIFLGYPKMEQGYICV